MSRFASLLAAATEEIDFGPAAFRVRGVSARLLADHSRFQLLLIGTPDADTRGALENLDRLRNEGGDPNALDAEQRAIFLDLTKRSLSPAVQDEQERVMLALLAAGVTHWRPAGEEDWRPCRIVGSGDPVEGPTDTIPVSVLPGAAAASQVLMAAVLRLSGMTEEVRQRVTRFRGGAGDASALGPDGATVSPPAK